MAVTKLYNSRVLKMLKTTTMEDNLTEDNLLQLWMTTFILIYNCNCMYLCIIRSANNWLDQLLMAYTDDEYYTGIIVELSNLK